MLMIQGNKKSWKLLIFQCKLLEIYIALRCSCLTLNFFFCAFGVHSFSLRGRYNICYYKQLKKNLMTHFWIEVFQVYSGQCLERVSDFFSVFAHFILYIYVSLSQIFRLIFVRMVNRKLKDDDVCCDSSNNIYFINMCRKVRYIFHDARRQQTTMSTCFVGPILISFYVIFIVSIEILF
jgi:hypothetical protein